MDALAVIVVMSPAAEASEWVEREVLEGQRHDRDFLPILLTGERLFLLASSHYFDARDGALPGGREIRQLRRILDARLTGAGQGPSLVLPAPVERPPAPVAYIPADVSLRKLRSFLVEEEIEHADILTTSLILEAVGRAGSGWIRRDDGQNLPFDLLADIDAAWSEFSHGAQGFRAQLSLHPSPGGAPAFSTLALSLGWRSTRRDTMPKYGKYGEFVTPADHPIGFFPTLRNPQLERYEAWHDKWRMTVMAVHLQLRRWRGQE